MNETPGSLTVLFDPHCGLCRWIKHWLQAQPSYVPLELVPAGSAEALARYPSLDPVDTQVNRTVVSDDGRVYQGEAGFLMCLYALTEFRGWALRLATPRGRPVLRAALAVLERVRKRTACKGACQARPSWSAAVPLATRLRARR